MHHCDNFLIRIAIKLILLLQSCLRTARETFICMKEINSLIYSKITRPVAKTTFVLNS